MNHPKRRGRSDHWISVARLSTNAVISDESWKSGMGDRALWTGMLVDGRFELTTCN